VKQQIRDIVTLLEKRGRESLPCVHMAFKGNPGTAKTTVARIVAKIFAQAGLSEKPDAFVETDSTGMIGQFVGHTAPLVKRTVGSAQGGVLFIDEAYGIAPPRGKEQSSFAGEALATLVKELEDRRDDFVCIMAGYTDEMNQFIDHNPGLRDRIAFHIDFPDYTANELVEIFKKISRESDYRVSQSAERVLREYFSCALTATDKNFSNGRLARKVLERARFKQAMRSDSNVIASADVRAAIASDDLSFDNKGSVSFGFVQIA
jgi:AAA+ superfamily predicted ATPase